MRNLLLTLLACFLLTGASQAADVVLRLGETHPKDYPTTQGDFKFAELVEKKSDGRIKVEVYYGKQLGEEKAVVEQVQLGAIDLTRVSLSVISSFYPMVDVLQMPYLYDSTDQMWRVLQGEIGESILDNIASKGFIGLCYYSSGARSFYTREPVTKVEDLKGLKIRVQQSKLMVGLVNCFGAIAQPMPFGEVYSALQTGVIDGAENNWPSYYSTKHYEVAKNYILDKHTQVPEIMIMSSRAAKEKLSADDIKIIKEAAKESVAFQRKKWDEFVQISKDAVEKSGAVITPVTNYKPFQDAVQPLYDALSAEQKELVKQIRATK